MRLNCHHPINFNKVNITENLKRPLSLVYSYSIFIITALQLQQVLWSRNIKIKVRKTFGFNHRKTELRLPASLALWFKQWPNHLNSSARQTHSMLKIIIKKICCLSLLEREKTKQEIQYVFHAENELCTFLAPWLPNLDCIHNQNC